MIFLGCLFDRAHEKEYLKKSKCGLSNAANMFQWNLIEGLNANLQDPVSIVNVLPVGVFPLQYKALFLPTREWSFNGSKNRELGCINFPFVKQYMRYKKCFKLLKKSKDKQIVVYSAYYPFLKAVSNLDDSYIVTLVVPDLPEFYDYGRAGKLKAFFRKRNNKKIQRALERIDKFVLLTEAMKEPLRVGERPYTVVEGICSTCVPQEARKVEEKEKIILYTGTLHRKFGIGNLLSAFSEIKQKEYRLWLCGGGDMKQEIVRAAKEDPRIHFFGYVSKEEINELQQKATVLVNPRQNNEEYTKYSFPSKTMEYMLSGKPVVMYHLDGIPKEYDAYLRYVKNDSIDCLKETLLDICESTAEERRRIGAMAQDFVLKKNSTAQAAKVLKLFVDS